MTTAQQVRSAPIRPLSACPRIRRRLPRRRAAVLLACVALATVLLVEGLRFAVAYRDLAAGHTAFASVETVLRNSAQLATISAADVTRLRTRLVGARQRFRAADAMVREDPLLALGARLPLVGRQVRAARQIAAIGVELGDAGVAGADVLDALRQERDAAGLGLLEKVVPALTRVQPQVETIASHVHAVQRLRGEIHSGGLWPPLGAVVATLDADLPRADAALAAYRDALAAAPAALGYAGPRTYLVLGHDNSEMLGSGGFVLIYGLVTLDQGKLSRLFFDNVANLQPDWPPPDPEHYLRPPQPLATYLLGDWPMGLAEASWWLDFASSAQEAIGIYDTSVAAPIDGVIGVDLFTLQALLRLTGPLTVEQYGLTVTPENVIDTTLVYDNPPGALAGVAPYAFALSLATQLTNRVLGLPAASLPQLFSTLQQLVGGRHVAAFTVDPETEQILEARSLAGRVRQDGGDYLLVADSSVGETKMNLFVRWAATLDVTVSGDGSATNVLTLAYETPYSAWMAGKDPRLAGVITGSRPAYGDYLRVLVPQAATLLSFTHDGLHAAPQPPATEAGRSELAAVFVLPIDARTALSFTYTVPGVVEANGEARTYRLLLQKQPGNEGGSVAVSVHAPPGSVVRHVALDGVEQPTGFPVTVALLTDHELRVSFAPAAATGARDKRG